jgi:hypothetical protein
MSYGQSITLQADDEDIEALREVEITTTKKTRRLSLTVEFSKVFHLEPIDKPKPKESEVTKEEIPKEINDESIQWNITSLYWRFCRS